MRTSAHVYPKTVVVNDTAAYEDVLSYTTDKENQIVLVLVEYYNSDNEPVERAVYEIRENNYMLLMSESPDFTPGKPANDFRRDDLWYILDLIRQSSEVSA